MFQFDLTTAMLTTVVGPGDSFDVKSVIYNDTVVYANGDTEMTVLSPGESTSALTSQMAMRLISNAEYAAVDDIDITITGYAIGIKDVDTNPTDAWNECKAIGGIQ